MKSGLVVMLAMVATVIVMWRSGESVVVVVRPACGYYS